MSFGGDGGFVEGARHLEDFARERVFYGVAKGLVGEANEFVVAQDVLGEEVQVQFATKLGAELALVAELQACTERLGEALFVLQWHGVEVTVPRVIKLF